MGRRSRAGGSEAFLIGVRINQLNRNGVAGMLVNWKLNSGRPVQFWLLMFDLVTSTVLKRGFCIRNVTNEPDPELFHQNVVKGS